VGINANELNVYVNKIRFNTRSLTNCIVFSSSLSGIKYTYNLNSSSEIIVPYDLNMSIITVKEIHIVQEEEREVNCPYTLKFIGNTSNLAKSNKPIIIPYGFDLSYLSKTEEINAEGEGQYSKEYFDSLVITNSLPKHNKTNKQIIIPYGLRTSIGDNGIIFHKPGDGITDNTSPHQLEISFGVKFDYDENKFIIRKPGNPTQCVKIAWRPV
jgi:hypothetical protein